MPTVRLEKDTTRQTTITWCRFYKNTSVKSCLSQPNIQDATVYPEDFFERIWALAAGRQLPFPYLHDKTGLLSRATR